MVIFVVAALTSVTVYRPLTPVPPAQVTLTSLFCATAFVRLWMPALTKRTLPLLSS
jgi:hypothetical protein